MKLKKQIFAAVLALSGVVFSSATAIPPVISSPDGDISVGLADGSDGWPELSVSFRGRLLVDKATIGMSFRGRTPGMSVKKIGKPGFVTEDISSPFHHVSHYTDKYNEMEVSLDKGMRLQVRVYDNGVAYRFKTRCKENLIVENEIADYDFPDDTGLYLSHSTNRENPFAMAFQNYYVDTPMTSASDIPAFLPACVDYGDGLKLVVLESDLESYPGMFVRADSVRGALRGVFAQYPDSTGYYPWRCQEYVASVKDHIAEVSGSRAFPWRIFSITESDRDMPVSNLVYSLASPSRVKDTDWIRPGKVAWDWWNDWGLRGVDFKAGINTETYRHYIDFASDNNIEYIVLDEGWYDPRGGDMLTVVADIDLPELIEYGKKKNVGIVLWTVFNVLDSRLEETCRKYSEMGIKGFKVDFLDRDDQKAVEMAYRIAGECAANRLFLDYHGFYKPTGLNRTYPNIVNFEAVFGMEEMKWSDPSVDMPLYDVTFPYLRMMCGPVDYTPGAMRNASKADWKPVYYNPASMGTRSHQGAAYIVHDSPFTMLCDSPSLYRKNQDWVDFITMIPTVFDSTEILDGKMGEYIVTLREKDGRYYIGGMTDWTPRDYTLDFSFLPDGGKWRACVMSDGVNADKEADDYAFDRFTVDHDFKQTIRMASGGGFAIVVEPLDRE